MLLRPSNWLASIFDMENLDEALAIDIPRHRVRTKSLDNQLIAGFAITSVDSFSERGIEA